MMLLDPDQTSRNDPDFVGYTVLVGLWTMMVAAIALLARFSAELLP